MKLEGQSIRRSECREIGMMSRTAQVLTGDVLAAASGDRQAYGRIVAGYGSLVCSIALAITGDRDASEEVGQDVFLAAWKDLPRLKNPASLLPWLRQMTRNKARDVIRARVTHRRFHVTQAHADHALESVIAPNPDVSDQMLEREEHEVLGDAIAALPDETREVITLFYREGESAAHVAALLGLREDAVKKRLSRARSVLREALSRRFGQVLLSTAPSALFTDRVLHAITTGLPVTASAAGKVAAAKAAKAGASALLVKLAAFLGPAIGLVGGLIGLFITTRRDELKASDGRRRTQIRTLAVARGLLLLMSSGAFLLHSFGHGSARLVVGLAGAFMIFESLAATLIRDRMFSAEVSARRSRTGVIAGVLAVLGAAMVLLALFFHGRP
jgi:RNA polymerase sigma factor (sigma-70 family)